MAGQEPQVEWTEGGRTAVRPVQTMTSTGAEVQTVTSTGAEEQRLLQCEGAMRQMLSGDCSVVPRFVSLLLTYFTTDVPASHDDKNAFVFEMSARVQRIMQLLFTLSIVTPNEPIDFDSDYDTPPSFIAKPPSLGSYITYKSLPAVGIGMLISYGITRMLAVGYLLGALSIVKMNQATRLVLAAAALCSGGSAAVGYHMCTFLLGYDLAAHTGPFTWRSHLGALSVLAVGLRLWPV